MKNTKLEELQEEEEELWEKIEEVYNDKERNFSTIEQFITELVDVNIELEKECNK